MAISEPSSRATRRAGMRAHPVPRSRCQPEGSGSPSRLSLFTIIQATEHLPAGSAIFIPARPIDRPSWLVLLLTADCWNRRRHFRNFFERNNPTKFQRHGSMTLRGWFGAATSQSVNRTGGATWEGCETIDWHDKQTKHTTRFQEKSVGLPNFAKLPPGRLRLAYARQHGWMRARAVPWERAERGQSPRPPGANRRPRRAIPGRVEG